MVYSCFIRKVVYDMKKNAQNIKKLLCICLSVHTSAAQFEQMISCRLKYSESFFSLSILL